LCLMVAAMKAPSMVYSMIYETDMITIIIKHP